MRPWLGLVFTVACLAAGAPVEAQISRFQHVVLIVQENRTPDDLFYALCDTKPCSTKPDATHYDIQTGSWLSSQGPVDPKPIALANTYDLEHRHADFVHMCDFDQASQACRMDGADKIVCKPVANCPKNPQFRFVDNSAGRIAPYIFLAGQYGWANYMFQTNQGPSFPAHQFLFGATSAPSSDDDHGGTFVAENLKHSVDNGCTAPPDYTIQLIDANGVEDPNNRIYPCAEHQTLADLLDGQSIGWRYYSPGAGDLWTAPDAIDHICQPVNQQCTGAEWNANVDLNPINALSDIKSCGLRPVSWIIPSAQFSDHGGSNMGWGPKWVAALVNAIGASTCTNPDGSSYWNTTAIIILWDDWGGWYDHESPTFLPYPEGGYQYGFRVPMLFVSAYTPAGFINNKRLDFGTIVRFVEFNFGIPMGALTFADDRSTRNLGEFYDLTQAPRPFAKVPGTESSFLGLRRAKMPMLAPDDD